LGGVLGRVRGACIRSRWWPRVGFDLAGCATGAGGSATFGVFLSSPGHRGISGFTARAARSQQASARFSLFRTDAIPIIDAVPTEPDRRTPALFKARWRLQAFSHAIVVAPTSRSLVQDEMASGAVTATTAPTTKRGITRLRHH
jgi:hypothetical protein